MILYRVEFYNVENSSEGFLWFTSLHDAVKQAAQFKKERPGTEDLTTVSRVEIPVTKIGILDALRKYATHPDNG